MKVLVDSSIWSLMLRRKSPGVNRETEILLQLIQERRALLIGAIRQEILTGISHRLAFERLALKLQAFPDLSLDRGDYVNAASFANTCRARGIQGSTTDFLICAAAVRHNLAIYTADNDFKHFAEHLPIKLYLKNTNGGLP
ncbi:MAG: PIN domain-containing protein [Candidatus Hydrogenedentes bacterium]|nr:PIN domain-containing protein [Candidatus Hydrogenedentota bacterium]